jgi:hypothetical protein
MNTEGELPDCHCAECAAAARPRARIRASISKLKTYIKGSSPSVPIEQRPRLADPSVFVPHGPARKAAQKRASAIKRAENKAEHIRRDTVFNGMMRMGLGDPECEQWTGLSLSLPIEPWTMQAPPDGSQEDASNDDIAAAMLNTRVPPPGSPPQDVSDEVRAAATSNPFMDWNPGAPEMAGGVDASQPDKKTPLPREEPEVEKPGAGSRASLVGPRGERLSEQVVESSIPQSKPSEPPNRMDGPRKMSTASESANTKAGNKQGKQPVRDNIPHKTQPATAKAVGMKGKRPARDDEDAIVPAQDDYPRYLDEDGFWRRLAPSEPKSAEDQPRDQPRYDVAQGI